MCISKGSLLYKISATENYTTKTIIVLPNIEWNWMGSVYQAQTMTMLKFNNLKKMYDKNINGDDDDY